MLQGETTDSINSADSTPQIPQNKLYRTFQGNQEVILGVGFRNYPFNVGVPFEGVVQCDPPVRAVPEIILGGRKHFFVRWGGGCFVDNVSEGGWRGNLSWGSRHI